MCEIAGEIIAIQPLGMRYLSNVKSRSALRMTMMSGGWVRSVSLSRRSSSTMLRVVSMVISVLPRITLACSSKSGGSR